jgi:large subunit ribosomal protein L11e
VKISFLFRGAKAEELLERGFKVKEYELRKENFSGRDSWRLKQNHGCAVNADPDPAFSKQAWFRKQGSAA